MGREIEIPVLIAGGSLVGLSSAVLLGHHGIRSLTVEHHRGTAIHPRAAQITQRSMEIFRSVGIEPTAKRYLLLKSRIHYRAGFLPISKAIVECNGVGVTGSDYTQFKFIKLRRPIFPLDQDTDF